MRSPFAKTGRPEERTAVWTFQGAIPNKNPLWSLTDERQSSRPKGAQPRVCDENGPAAALLLGHVSIQICSFYRQSGSDRLAGGPF